MKYYEIEVYQIPLEMAEHDRRRWRLVLVVSPLQGHMTPMLQLGTYLHSKGFSITIAHSELNRPDPSHHPNFIFFPLPHNLSVPMPSDFPSFIEFLQALNENCKSHLQEYLMQIMKAEKEKESVVIIYDHLMFCAGFIASSLGLPSIVMLSSSAAFFLTSSNVPLLHQQGRFPVQDYLLQEIIPEFHPFRYKDMPFIRIPMHQAFQLITMMTPKTVPNAFICNTLEFLEPLALTQIRQQYQVPFFTVGPVHMITKTPSTSFLEEDIACISWLDKQAPKSVIYVSLGSLATIDEKVSTQMALSLANSKQPFLWVVRPGSVLGFKWIDFIPDGLLAEMTESGLIVKWAPQKEVLAHTAVGGFWSHCGWNSILESVSEGVPMLCQPFGVDQRLNARYLSYAWKMGIETVGGIEGAITKVLVGKEGEEMRQEAMEIREKVEVAISLGGSSQNSLNNLVDFIMSM